MQAQRVLELRQQGRRELAEPPADALDGHGPHLFSLGLRVAGQAALGGGQQHLERIDVVAARAGMAPAAGEGLGGYLPTVSSRPRSRGSPGRPPTAGSAAPNVPVT